MPMVADDVSIAREAMHICSDDMAEESAARLRPLVDRPDSWVEPDRPGRFRMSGHVRAPVDRDPPIAALARYVESLHRRYPDGPGQLRREGLDGRAKVSGMTRIQKDPAA